jgi:hypothetical protein
MPGASGNLKAQIAEAFAGDVAASIESGQYFDAVQSVFGVTASTTAFGASSANLKNVQATAMMQMPGRFLISAASNTQATSTAGTTFFQYMGRVPKYATTATVISSIAVAAVTVAWAEMGVCAAAFNPGTTTSVTAILGSVAMTASSTNAITNALGTQLITTIPLTGVIPGQDIWVFQGSTSGTQGTLMGMTAASILQSGAFQTAATQASIATLPLATTLGSTAALPANVLLFI